MGPPAQVGGHSYPEDMGTVRDLIGHRDFRLLLTLRMLTQLADGAFEASLAILFFFSPEQSRTPLGIALAFAVLTLPFTLVGPWAGVPLDRWSRRNTLALGSAARGLLVLVAAALLGTGHDALPLYVVALAVVSINRFLLAAISAGLPHVVADAALVTANAITPTMGTVASVVGAGVAYTAISWGTSPARALAGVAVVPAMAVVVSLALGARRLGPDLGDATPGRRRVRRLMGEMDDGLRHLHSRPNAFAALEAMTAHRLFFGAATLAAILLARSDFGADDFGLSAGGRLVAAVSLGLVAAALTTPAWVRRSSPTLVGASALVVMGLAMALLAVAVAGWSLALVGVAVGWGGQSLKICVDTIVQRDVSDEFRGRVFSVYDVVFNLAFLVAMALLAPFLPQDGDSPALFAVLAVGYGGISALYLGPSARRRLQHVTPRL